MQAQATVPAASRVLTRWQAAAIHLLISAVIIGSITASVLALWYPVSLMRMSGSDELIMLIAAVDLVLGPLLTLIVYKHGKRGLKLDLTLIATVQALMLAYGISVLAVNRPVYLVAVPDRFELVMAGDIASEDLALAPPEYSTLPWTGYRTVGTRMPQTTEEHNALLDAAMAGRDIQVQPNYYVPYEQSQATLAQRIIPLRKMLERATPGQRDRIESAAGSRDPETLGYVSIVSIRGVAAMLMQLDGTPIEPMGVDPWEIELQPKRIAD